MEGEEADGEAEGDGDEQEEQQAAGGAVSVFHVVILSAAKDPCICSCRCFCLFLSHLAVIFTNSIAVILSEVQNLRICLLLPLLLVLPVFWIGKSSKLSDGRTQRIKCVLSSGERTSAGRA